MTPETLHDMDEEDLWRDYILPAAEEQSDTPRPLTWTYLLGALEDRILAIRVRRLMHPDTPEMNFDTLVHLAADCVIGIMLLGGPEGTRPKHMIEEPDARL